MINNENTIKSCVVTMEVPKVMFTHPLFSYQKDGLNLGTA